MLVWPFKDPAEILDYDIDWTQRLYSADEIDTINAGGTVASPADTIASSVFALPPGITSPQSSYTNTRTKVWLEGGTNGQTYEVVNTITTAGGRTMDQTVKIKVKTK